MQNVEIKAVTTMDPAHSQHLACPATSVRRDRAPDGEAGLETWSTRTTAQIGRCGELIESSAMTTDRGIDLVAFVASRNRALTIQVKTNLRPKPGGGRGAQNANLGELAKDRSGYSAH